MFAGGGCSGGQGAVGWIGGVDVLGVVLKPYDALANFRQRGQFFSGLN